MKVISTAHGFVLRFEDLEDMENHVFNLQGQIEDIKENSKEGPHLYSVYFPATSPEDMQEILDKI